MARSVVENVPEEFRAIRTKVRRSPLWGSTKKYLGARNTEIGGADYTSNVVNTFGRKEHFQGVQRIDSLLVLSGGIATGKRRSQLIVIEMGTKKRSAPKPWLHPAWASPKYGHSYKKPPETDVSVNVVDIDSQMWHAGGIQAVDDIVAVPIYKEHSNRSQIRFLRLTDGGRQHVEIHRMPKDDMEAKAVGVTKVDPELNGGSRYLLAIWDDYRLDFHFSKGDRLDFDPKSKTQITWDKLPLPYSKEGLLSRGFRAINDGPLAGTYQCINLITDAEGNVFIIAGRNTQKASPTITGKDILDLYQLRWPGSDLSRSPRVIPVDSKQMYCYNKRCNFGGASGAYIDEDGHLTIYATWHWLHTSRDRLSFKSRFAFNEYSTYR